MDQDAQKERVAEATHEYVFSTFRPLSIIGIGTGSTVNCFIDLLSKSRTLFTAAVSSSRSSTDRLQKHGIPVFETNTVEQCDVYVDGADEVNHSCVVIKGGGGALTQEKIVASISKHFVCMVDESKVVEKLGNFPLPIEVVPSAQFAVSNAVNKLGGTCEVRVGNTDNGNNIIDVSGLNLDDPCGLEQSLNNIPGVVTVGIFVEQRPDLVLIAHRDGRVSELSPNS